MMEVSNKYDFDSQITNNKRVLAFFYASWCPFCRSFLPLFAKNASKSDSCIVLYVKIDDYDNPLWDEYSIEAVPTVILFEAGKVCRRLDGRFGYGLSEKRLMEWLEEGTY
jgi:thiol-disulfide isomerase/thioredoxin